MNFQNDINLLDSSLESIDSAFGSMDLLNDNNDNTSNNSLTFCEELDEICQMIYEKIDPNYTNFINNIKRLQQGGKEIALWASEYDFEGISANGYWSLLKIGIKIGQLILDQCKNDENIHIDQNLTNLLEYSLIAIDVLKILREDSYEYSKKNNCEPSLQASSLKFFVELFGLLLSLENDKVGATYGNLCGFWLCNKSRYAAILFVSGLSLITNNIFDGVRCLISSHHRGIKFAELIKNADLSFVKKLRFFLESPIYNRALPTLLYFNKPKTIKNIYIPRQSEWILSSLNQKIMRSHGHSTLGLPNVRVKLFSTNDNFCNESKLIIHCHGGGFVLGTPESQELYLRDWASKVDNIPILSIDYTLAPEGKFPVALQEILDVYLWLTSGHHSVINILGFHPKQIVLVGDSAGGNLLAALCCVLCDIKKRDIYAPIQMPNSLVSLYSPFNVTLLLSPSLILSSCDSLLSAGLMLSCFEAYLPSFHSDDDQPIIDIKNYENFISDNINSLQPYEMVKQFLQFLKNITLNSKKSEPWYREEKNKLFKKVEKLYDITSNPYISPLYYDDFDSLSIIDLHLIGLHYDPFLDDNVTMAKKWKGKITFDVIDGIQHGFLNFMPFIDEARAASDLCVKRILEGFTF